MLALALKQYRIVSAPRCFLYGTTGRVNGKKMVSFMQQRKHQTVFLYLCVDIKSFGKVKQFLCQEKVKILVEIEVKTKIIDFSSMK